jgi:ethanolamine permease
VYKADGSSSDSPLPLALGKIVGDNNLLYHLLITVGLFGLVASFHGLILAAGRSTFEFGRVRFAPSFLGNVNSKFKTPANALLVNMTIGIAALLTGKTSEIITIAVFAYGGGALRNWIIARRVAKGKEPESPKFAKAQKAFDKYGIYGMAALGPILIGTQFAAAASVAAGVKPLKVTVLISAAMVIWAVAIAWVMVALGVSVGEFIEP